MRQLTQCTLILFLLLQPVFGQVTTRIKDITSYNNVNRTALVGYGLAIGLNGTGDRAIGTRGTIFTVQSIANMLEQFGITVDPKRLRTRNVAAVMVTANSPAYGRPGATFDVNVSSLGDATSLENGILLMTPLRDSRGNYFATAQGPISVGGFNITTLGGERLRQNYALVGRVPDGAMLERDLENISLNANEPLDLLLKEPNYTTASRIVDAINGFLPNIQPAQSLEAGVIRITFPANLTRITDLVSFVASIETLRVVQDVDARVVINERTGTVVAGGAVSIGAVMVSHGSLQIHTTTAPYVSQPGPFNAGQTVSIPITRTTVTEQGGEATMIGASTVAELSAALNDMGFKPRDIIAVFQAIKEAGALNARLIIM